MGEGVEARVKSSSAQVSVQRSQDPVAPGLIVTIQPGQDGYPGITVEAEGGVWDLSNYGHIEAKVTNLGTKSSPFNLRVDDNGDWKSNPWNAENIYLKPGASGTVKTIFGHSYGHKPAYPLKADKVTRILMFTGKSDVVQSFRIESVVADGPAGEKPPVDPNSIRITPQNGFLMGGEVALDAAKQISAKGAQTSLALDGGQPVIKAVLPAGQGERTVVVKPAQGRWDLRDCLEVRVRLRNDGQAPVTPKARVESNGGPSEWESIEALAPGAEGEIQVPFAASAPADLNKKDTGSKVTSDAVQAVTIATDNADAERILTVKSIMADMPPAPVLPDWLGKRPPVEGDWVQTLNENFDSDTLNTAIWDVYGANYWDKKTHWSKDNVILGNGEVKLRYEKKTGPQNDDPASPQTDYQAGYLHTYNKWTQLYGYFEARMKLPKAPGLWPAFWMMPDRGPAGGPEQWRRQMTENGGMEFDIMEHLTRWGPNRYNIAMHYDGYGKNHKAIGSPTVYIQPDKDGYITCGLLWTPGVVVYYANGQEVLRWTDPRIGSVPEMLMFTLPMGGWDNSPLDDTRLPDDFTIDYVRAWQRKDLVTPPEGK
jgi:beta-glucanase (GH16 family)